MAANIFKDNTSTIPKSDPKVSRIELDKSDFGARKSHISGIHKKNSNTIQHVKGS